MPPTTNEASRYQQLRGHLAYLKLADAAEALPAVLDTARTEKLSTTAALEKAAPHRGAGHRGAAAVRSAPVREPAHGGHPGRLRLRRPTRRRSRPDRGPGVEPVPGHRHQHSADRGRPVSAKPCSPWASPAPRQRPVPGPTSPPPPILRPAATGRRSRAAGPPRCASTPARRA